MKKIISIIFILFLVFTFSACKKKKDLPKNIPKWLQSIIEHEKKYSGWILTTSPLTYGQGPRYAEKMRIEEWTDGSSTYYHIDEDYPEHHDVVIYNYNGDKVCVPYNSYQIPCNNLGYKKDFVRTVFEE